MIKRLVALSLVLLVSIESFAAVVSDNDGSAFITKAEFDSLKNNFQSQIDQYNTSIDSKIDGAIASYLAGINVAKFTNLELDKSNHYKFPIYMHYNSSLWNDASSRYYIVGRPQTFYHQQFMSTLMAGAYIRNVFPNGITPFDTETDEIDWVTTNYWELPKPTLNNVTGNSTALTVYLQSRDWENTPEAYPLCELAPTTDTCIVEGEIVPVFSRRNFGIGYQQIDYEPTTSVTPGEWAGHLYDDRSGYFKYEAVVGLTTKQSSGRGLTTSAPFKDNELVQDGIGGSGAWGATNHNAHMSYINNFHKGWITYAGITYWNGSAAWGLHLTADDLKVRTSSFVWDEANSWSYAFAGSAYVPAGVNAQFGYQGVPGSGTDPLYANTLIRHGGYEKGFHINLDVGNTKKTGAFFAAYKNYIPKLTCIEFLPTVPDDLHVSAYPASMIRYTDDDGKIHFMDEGLFIKNFDKNGTVEFSLRFGGSSSNMQVRFYLSKKPFSNANQKNYLCTFNYKGSTDKKTEGNIYIEQKQTIVIDDIQKGDQLYLLWEPVNAGDFVYLNSFDNFIISED